MTASLVAVAYLPLHGPPIPDEHAIAAGLAALYVAVISVMAPAIVRRIVLRFRVARGSDDLASGALPSRRRISAIFAGAVMSLAGAIAGAGLSAALDPGTHAHATAGFALAVNVSLLAGALTPAPGFTGWPLLLGLVDAAGVRPDQRVQRAALMARAVGVPILGAGSAAAALLGSPLIAIGGVLLVTVTWTRSRPAADGELVLRRQVAAGRDALVGYLSVHTAGEAAWPATHQVGSSEVVGVVSAGLRDSDIVSLVEADGQIIGAIGPRQRAARCTTGSDTPSDAIMVPIGLLALLEPRSPAVELLPDLARHGFSLVSGPTGLAYVTPALLGRQVGSWVGQDAAPERDVASVETASGGG